MSDFRNTKFYKNNYCKKALLSKLLLSVFVSIFFCFTIFFFSPIEVFLGNSNAFIFSLGNIWWILLVHALIFSASLVFISLALPVVAALVFDIFIFSLGICGYVQSMFLNGAMGSLTGEGDVYSNTTVYANIAIWGVIIAGLITISVILFKKGKFDTFKKAICFVASALIFMQLTAFCVSAISASSAEQYFYLSNKGQYQLSSGKNTVIFIVDTCDGYYVDKMLQENPEAIEGFDGFINYPDAVAKHSRTYPSLPFLLTREVCYFDKPYDTFINDAHENSTYLKDIYENGVNIGLYTDSQYVGNSSTGYIANSKLFEGNAKVSFGGTFLWMSRMSLYRNMPYIFKSVFNYTDRDMNSGCMEIEDACYSSDDFKLYNQLKTDGLKITDEYGKSLRLYHLWGAHAGADFDRNLNEVSYAEPYEAMLGDFKIIQEYIGYMKDAGIYDDSTIIITADHGLSGGTSDEKPLEIDRPVRSLLMVKPAGTEGKIGMTTSNAPVSHDDLFATVIESFGGNTEPYGKTIFEIKENEQRTRLYYHTMMYSDTDGEVALREYAITGDSRDFNNWKLTGNYWDIKFSERAVSRHRLSDILE